MKVSVDNVRVVLDDHEIVREVSLEIEPGSVVGLVGPNGSGKSTLLRTMYRMLKPESGVISLNGQSVWELSAREAAQRVGVVAQEMPSEFDYTVFEIVMMGRTPHKGLLERDTTADREIVHEALARVGMSDFEHRVMATLSGGEKQRVLIARALAQQTRFLILDEPTNHLDIRYQIDILELVSGLGVSTLVTLHDLNLAAAYCDWIYLLQAGQLVARGPAAAVLTPDLVEQVFEVSCVCNPHPTTGKLQLSFFPSVTEPAGEQE